MNRDAAKALFFAVALAAAGLALLAWQYNRLAEQRLPEIEERLEQQKREIEAQKAQNTVDAFFSSRLVGNEDQARQYLTERSVQQVGEYPALLRQVAGYEVLDQAMQGEGEARFQVEVLLREAPFSRVETLLLKKILDRYYIDSVQIAG